MFPSPRVTIFHFISKTQWQIFLLLYGRLVCVPPKGTNMASLSQPYKFGWHTSLNNARLKNSLRAGLYINHLSYPKFLTLFIESVTIFSFDHLTKPRIISLFSFLARISSKERASVKISSPLCVDFCGNTVIWSSCYFSSHLVVFLAKTKTQEECATKSLNNGLYWTTRILKKTP